MVVSESDMRNHIRKLMLSRMRILANHGFFGLLLMHIKFALENGCQNVAASANCIYFNPEFLSSIDGKELDFVLMHEILHIALQHCFRINGRDTSAFALACDIVVNSNILLENNMDISTITLHNYGTAIHTAPNGKEGFNYTAEEVYEMLKRTARFVNLFESENIASSCAGTLFKPVVQNRLAPNNSSIKSIKDTAAEYLHNKNALKHAVSKGRFDDHSKWNQGQSCSTGGIIEDTWIKHIKTAAEAAEKRHPNFGRGCLPECIRRFLNELPKSQTDWRTILAEFVQSDITDYSFTPPDKRFDECDFFLPDFNEKSDYAADILFMIDTSGSMSDQMVSAAYSEVKGAIDQFDGKLSGWLGFFDADIKKPMQFCDESELKNIKPIGGGGTDFQVIFDYINKHMQNKPPLCIIILTDGYAPFPKQSEASGIPVLWLLNNKDITPPWGKIARITL